ncbi:unnamed protein product [Bubo scandiacus]
MLLFNCSRFCHSPLTVLSDFQELLCLVFVLEEGFCYILYVFCGLQIYSCQSAALCWKPLPSCTLRQRAFPILPPVLVLHCSNVSILYLLQ